MNPDYQHVPPWSWSLERRLEYATNRWEKTVETHPGIAAQWLREVEMLENRIAQQNALTQPNDISQLA
jgi:hypothetical protein